MDRDKGSTKAGGQSNAQIDKRNWKLLVDPFVKKGLQKLYRFEGICSGSGNSSYNVSHLTDPRRHIPRFWARSEPPDLPLPSFKIDENYVGTPPAREVSFFGLNDNINQHFLVDLCKKLGEISEVKIYFHPVTKKHLGLARVIFKRVREAQACVERYNDTSVMGKKIRCSLDSFGKEVKESFQDLTTEQVKHVISPDFTPSKQPGGRDLSRSLSQLELQKATAVSTPQVPEDPPQPTTVNAPVWPPPPPPPSLGGGHMPPFWPPPLPAGWPRPPAPPAPDHPTYTTNEDNQLTYRDNKRPMTDAFAATDRASTSTDSRRKKSYEGHKNDRRDHSSERRPRCRRQKEERREQQYSSDSDEQQSHRHRGNRESPYYVKEEYYRRKTGRSSPRDHHKSKSDSKTKQEEYVDEIEEYKLISRRYHKRRKKSSERDEGELESVSSSEDDVAQQPSTSSRSPPKARRRRNRRQRRSSSRDSSASSGSASSGTSSAGEAAVAMEDVSESDTSAGQNADESDSVAQGTGSKGTPVQDERRVDSPSASTTAENSLESRIQSILRGAEEQLGVKAAQVAPLPSPKQTTPTREKSQEPSATPPAESEPPKVKPFVPEQPSRPPWRPQWPCRPPPRVAPRPRTPFGFPPMSPFPPNCRPMMPFGMMNHPPFGVYPRMPGMHWFPPDIGPPGMSVFPDCDKEPSTPETDGKNVAKHSMDGLVNELRVVLCKDLSRRLIEVSAFSALDTWWTERRAIVTEPPKKIKPEDATEQEQDVSASIRTSTDESFSASLSKLFDSKNLGDLSGLPGFGMRAAMPKLPSFKRKILPKERIEPEEDEMNVERSPVHRVSSSSSSGRSSPVSSSSSDSEDESAVTDKSDGEVSSKSTVRKSESSSSSSSSSSSDTESAASDSEETDTSVPKEDERKKQSTPAPVEPVKRVSPVPKAPLETVVQTQPILPVAPPAVEAPPTVDTLDAMIVKGKYSPLVYDHCYPKDPSMAPPAKKARILHPKQPAAAPRAIPASQQIRKRKAAPQVEFRRWTEEEVQTNTDAFMKGMDEEDVNFLRRAYELLLQNAEIKDRFKSLCWFQYSLAYQCPSPTKKARKESPDESRRHETGCARTEGYYKFTVKEKSRLIRQARRVFERTELQSQQDVQVARQQAQMGREARSLQRRLLTSLGGDVESDLLKVNQLRFRKKLIRFGRSHIHGWGLFALEAIVPDEMIVEYVGEKVRYTVADRREVHYERVGMGSSYLFRVDNDTVIDATKRGALARFINHSCTPSCYAKIITVEGAKRIVIYSKKHIAVGEEITYDYKFPIEDDKIACLCGSLNCRGSLN